MPDVYLILDGQQMGPYSPDQVRQLVAEGNATADALAWYQGLAEWGTVSSVLASFSAAGGPPPPMPVPPPPARRSPERYERMPHCRDHRRSGAGPNPALLRRHRARPHHRRDPEGEGTRAHADQPTDWTRHVFLCHGSQRRVSGGEKTSTEVFQKLLDEKYIADPSIFFLAMPGKVKATSQTLTADNVCFDVTSGITATLLAICRWCTRPAT